MKNDVMLPWPADLKEVIFAHHTILLDELTLVDHIQKHIESQQIFGAKLYVNKFMNFMEKNKTQVNSMKSSLRYKDADNSFHKLNKLLGQDLIDKVE